MSRAARLQKAANFTLYYGFGREDEMSAFDVAIIDINGHTPEAVHKMQEKDTLVIAYISVMEIGPAHADFPILKQEDLLHVDGSAVMNDAFGNHLVDLRSTRWTRLILHYAGRAVNQFGVDGFFLDTIGDLEDPNLPQDVRDIQLVAAVGLVKKIRDMFLDHLIIQNSGLDNICYYTAALINGICWENPSLSRLDHSHWNEKVLHCLDMMKERHGLKVFLLLEEKKDRTGFEVDDDKSFNSDFLLATRLAAQKGFLVYLSKGNYVDSVNLSRVNVIREKS